MRDIGGATRWMKMLVEEGVVIGPRLKIAICMLSTTGGHADFKGPDRCHATISRLWPEEPGRYVLELDLLLGGVVWFEEITGRRIARGEVDVTAGAPGDQGR